MGTLFISQDGSGNVSVIYAQARGVNDNSYGVNAVGWPGGHKFGDLVGSDQAVFEFKDKNGNVVLGFDLDYISAAAGDAVRLCQPGRQGGEGNMNVGSASQEPGLEYVAGAQPEQHGLLRERGLHGQRRQPARQLAADDQQYQLHPAGRLALRPVELHQLVRGDGQQGRLRRRRLRQRGHRESAQLAGQVQHRQPRALCARWRTHRRG